jgi:hypothetical protein
MYIYEYIITGKNDDNYAVASELVSLDKTKKELKIYLSKKIEKDTQLEVCIHVCIFICSYIYGYF